MKRLACAVPAVKLRVSCAFRAVIPHFRFTTFAGPQPALYFRMDETTPPQTPESNSGLNKLDLSQLQGFSFGTSWSLDKGGGAPGSAPRGDRSDRRDDRPRREGGGGDAPVRRDRRDFKRPVSAPVTEGGAVPPAAGGEPPPRRDGSYAGPGGGGQGGPRTGERPRFERRDGPGAGPGGPRREGGGGGQGGHRGDFRGPPREPAGPYISPFFGVTFYPEDGSFKILADAIRKSCRTFELFYIAKSVVEKNERFVAVVQRLQPGARSGAPASAEGSLPATPGVKPAPFFISVPDGVPFETEDAAIAHVLEKHLGNFFDTAEVEIDPPKGNFQVVNRCSITGTLLAPPNYHLYNSILAQHHAANVRMPLEAYKTKIESVRDPEVVAQWLEKMKKTTRYTVKPAPVKAPKGGASAAPFVEGGEPAAAPAAVENTENMEAATTPAAEAVAPEAPAAPVMPSFDSLEEARQYLLTEVRNRVVRSVEQLRFPGKLLENVPANTEIRRAVEGALAAQRRFPLDTANALRGRLRRESFTIFKKGSKGISYVCAVKRRFRVPGQSFSDSLASLIAYIEAHPMIKESELGEKHLGLVPVAAPAEGVAPQPVSPETQEKLTKLKGDLRYLVKEGYVTEFVDGTLFCPPAMVEARKREIEASDVDPENFPDAPKPAAAAAAKPAPAPVVQSVAADVAEPAPAEPAADSSGEPATDETPTA